METVNYKECITRLANTLGKQKEFNAFVYSTMLAVVFDKHKEHTLTDLIKEIKKVKG